MSEITVDLNFTERLLDLCVENNIDFSEYLGSLMDNYIIYDTKSLKITGVRRTNYIVIKECFRNEWNSELVLIATDSLKKVEEYEYQFESTISQQ